MADPAPAPAPPASRAVPRERWLPALLGASWLAWFGVLQWSVVRFRVPILLTLTVVTVLLGAWVVRRVEVPLPRWLAPVVLLGADGGNQVLPPDQGRTDRSTVTFSETGSFYFATRNASAIEHGHIIVDP